MAYRHVVALGSSFAAGPGIPPVVDRIAGRSGANYAQLVAADLGAEITDLTVSGATIATVLSEPQRIARKSYPPQVSGVPVDADLVTVTVGGNDLGYLASLLRLAWANHFGKRFYTRPLGRRLGQAPVPVLDTDGVVEGLTRIVDAVHEKAPGARVLLVDYLTVLGDDALFTPPQLTALRALGKRVNGAFVMAAQASGATLVKASALGHGLGSPEPYVNGFENRRAAFHPNAAGMRAVADEIIRTLVA